jgi:hypothetical protein
MGKLRFLYNNLISSESMLAVSSAKTGLVTNALKNGTGSAVITTGGTYTGTVDLEYVIEIDGAGTGEIGSSTFKWSDDGGATWDATGVATAATAITLNNGVTILWTAGSGADFVLADKWYFKAIQPFSAGKMIDLDRDHRYRSAALSSPNTITATLAAEAAVDAICIFDHNFTSGATIHLYGDDAATFNSGPGSAPQVDETITWTDDKILHYLTTADRTKKYWQLRVADTGNSDGYIEIGELFLGSYLELSKNYSEGFGKPLAFIMDTNRTPYGIERDRFYNTQLTFSLDFNLITTTDITNLNTLISTVTSRANGTNKPFWINTDSATPSDMWLVKIAGLPVKHNTLTYYDLPLELKEVLKSV